MHKIRAVTLGLGLGLSLVTAALADTAGTAAELRVAALMGQEQAAMRSVRRNHVERILTPARGSAAEEFANRFDAGWLRALPEPEGGEELACLARALYFEARGEGITGQFAVAAVVLNRVESASYPDTICGVVNQGAQRSSGCQFSFTCDGNSDRISESDAYDIARRIARLMKDGAPRDLTSEATHFHTVAVSPGWAARLDRTARIGAHLFYREPTRLSAN
ncbi:cell wall hydrolase [Alkalilacustris brevis]|uniref:cell wall hydrolase n=1 Tax=Alkalilacustris brevis TaxID=2026338 RepID=UPI001EE4B720|nr:cell wall hydrolase [Alkalilacustris brevis]